jgi:hypothetical protein
LPPNFDPTHTAHSLGLQIVHTLVTDDLKGTLRMESILAAGEEAPTVAGTRAIVTLPKRSGRTG